MKQVSIKEARKRLSELVDAATRGESFVITRRGRAVAKIAPNTPQKAVRMPDLSEFRKSIKVSGKPLSQVVIDERRRARY
jgi:prevent-host-death family protein